MPSHASHVPPGETSLGWLLARAPQTVPVPGVRTVAQAEQNAEVIRLGPLGPDEMAEICKLEI